MKFRAHPASRELHQRLLRSGGKQVIFQHENSGHRLTCWPVDEESWVLKLSEIGALADAPDLKFAHDLMADAEVDVLGTLDGYANRVAAGFARDRTAAVRARAIDRWARIAGRFG